MLFRLILRYLAFVVLVASSQAFSQESSFAFSPQWKSLLHYRPTLFKNESRAQHAEFFLSPNGKKDLLEEYQANVTSLLNDKNYPCRFPARAMVLADHLDNKKLADFTPCFELNNWLRDLGHDEISLVFAGAYSNNPASLFGHTFLKFSKKLRNPLLNYVVAFLARTDPRDSAPVYTWKGLMGGYLGFFEIQHFSMSIGLYNNSESRDLWEYSLELDEKQRQLVAMHLWELIHYTGFNYYFTDENCSYLLLALLDVAMPQKKLTEKSSLFVMPIETVKTLKEKIEGVEYIDHRASLQSKITFRLNQKSAGFVKDYIKIQNSYDLRNYSQDKQMLELLIDTYHLKNYKEKTNLSVSDQDFLYKLLQLRSKLPQQSQEVLPRAPARPDLSHSPHRFRTQISSEQISGELSYGLHRLIDPKDGYEDFSYIDFFSLEGSYLFEERSFRYERFTLVDISSWEPVSLANANLSWQVTVQSLKEDEVFEQSSLLNLKGGPGVSYIAQQWGSAFFLGTDIKMTYKNQRTQVLPYFEWQSFYRPIFLKNVSSALVMRYFSHNRRASLHTHFELAWHLVKDFSLSLTYRSTRFAQKKSEDDLGLSLSYRF